MKLYTEYKKALEAIGKLEIAWFTTFNCNPEIIEKYLVPAIFDISPAELKTSEDFERLNKEITDSKIDLKVWYDYRALDLSSRKFTTIPFISINPSALHSPAGSLDAIFHPKVIFLKGENGAIIITSSANLTFAAWSSNAESCLIREVEKRQNAKQIIDFFKRIGAETAELDGWIKTLKKEESNWEFYHSFETKNLIEKLDATDEKLLVWSPYFSQATSTLTKKINDLGFNDISIIPDLSSGKIRISEEDLALMVQNKLAKFLNHSSNEVDRFIHAKMWLSPKSVAIGSWNYTGKATGVGLKINERNIEAGIIQKIDQKAFDSLQTGLSPINYLEGTSIEKLEEEWKDVLAKFSYSCTIYINWSNFKYEFTLDDLSNDLMVELPDNPTEKISLSSVNKKSFAHNLRKLLKDRTFRVYKSKELVFEGLLFEKSCEKREAYGYITLDDAMNALMRGIEELSVRRNVMYRTEGDETTEESDILIKESELPSYYIMFVAMEKLYVSLENNEENFRKLEDIGYRLPGSIQNLRELIIESYNIVKDKTNQDILVYYWFLMNELNRCISRFNELMNDKDIEPHTDLNTEIKQIKALLKPSEHDEKFMNKMVNIHYK